MLQPESLLSKASWPRGIKEEANQMNNLKKRLQEHEKGSWNCRIFIGCLTLISCRRATSKILNNYVSQMIYTIKSWVYSSNEVLKQSKRGPYWSNARETNWNHWLMTWNYTLQTIKLYFRLNSVGRCSWYSQGISWWTRSHFYFMRLTLWQQESSSTACQTY